MRRTAIVLGATGLTGSLLVNKLLESNEYSNVLVFVRSKINLVHPKLQVNQIDLLKLKDYKSLFKSDVVFCCIGTTKAKTPDLDLYKQIDYGIPLAAAQICKLNGISNFIVISSMGANPNSSIFYSRIKGEMEQAVLDLNIKNIFILRPSLITGDRNEVRFFELMVKYAMQVLNVFLVGSLKKYQSIKAETIAKAMIDLDLKGYHKNIIESDQIKELVHNA